MYNEVTSRGEHHPRRPLCDRGQQYIAQSTGQFLWSNARREKSDSGPPLIVLTQETSEAIRVCNFAAEHGRSLTTHVASSGYRAPKSSPPRNEEHRHAKPRNRCKSLSVFAPVVHHQSLLQRHPLCIPINPARRHAWRGFSLLLPNLAGVGARDQTPAGERVTGVRLFPSGGTFRCCQRPSQVVHTPPRTKDGCGETQSSRQYTPEAHERDRHGRCKCDATVSNFFNLGARARNPGRICAPSSSLPPSEPPSPTFIVGDFFCSSRINVDHQDAASAPLTPCPDR